MAKTFDPTPLFEALPSFYRDYLSGQDRIFLQRLWEGLIRIIDAEYARLIQVANSNKVAKASATTLYPWIREEFDWTSQRVKHQHVVIEALSDDDQTFYLGRYVDPNAIEVYYNGVRLALGALDVATNNSDAAQRAGSQPLGTRIVFDQALSPVDKTLTVLAERELFHSTGTTDGSAWQIDATWFDGATNVDAEVDPDFWSVSLTHRNITGAVITGNGTASPTVNLGAGFKAGQVIELEFAGGGKIQQTVDADSTSLAFTLTGAETVTDVRQVLNIPVYPRAATVSATRVNFDFSLPVGAQVRVRDQGQAQSYTVTDAGITSIRLDHEVDPDNTSVFMYGFDLLAVEVTDTSFSFGRAPTAGLDYKATSSYRFLHDHARYTETIASDTATITLPETRPLALDSGLSMIPRYPIMVYLDGTLLTSSEYTINSTVEIERVGGDFLTGEVVDVRYADAEDPEEHKHIVEKIVLPAGQTLSVAPFSEPINSTKYPVYLSYDGIGMLDPTPQAVNASQYVVVPDISDASTINIYLDGAVFKLNYQHRMDSRVDMSESYTGTLVSADSLQDGINAPTVVMEGDGLMITRSGDMTLIEGDTAIDVGWFRNAQVDEHLVSEVLGRPVGLPDAGATTGAYLDAILALHSAYYKGSQVDTLENFACIILGSDYIPKEGTNRGLVTQDDGTQVRRVSLEDGTTYDAALDPDIPARAVTDELSRFYAVNAHCQFVDKDFTDLPYLAFMAEATSDTYRYAKRLDVREPRTLTSVPTSFNGDTKLLYDDKVDFFDYEVRPGDLVQLVTSAEDDGYITVDSQTYYVRVDRVLDRHTIRVDVTLPTGVYGWGTPELGTDPGDPGWGGDPGNISWGGLSLSASIDGYTIWTRLTRTIDIGLHHDEMLDDAQAIAVGESVQRVNAILADILNRFIFAVNINWEAQKDQERLEYLKYFLDTAKAAETGYFAYTRVNNDDGIQDSFSGTLVEQDVTLSLPTRDTYIEQDFIESWFIPGP